MAEAGEYRALSEWNRTRTVCHGCRSMVYEMSPADDGVAQLRSVVIPGDGSISRAVAADNEAGDTFVTQPCPVCGDSDTPGWLPGFVPPV